MTTHCNCNGNLIPHGNDFYLAIALKSRSLVDGEVVETPFDFEAADTYNARIYGILDGATLSTVVGLKDGTTDTVIIDAKGVPLIRAIGVEVTGEVDGRAFRAAEKGFLSIVEFNGEARVVFTPVTGGQEANLVMTLTFLPSAAVVGKNAYEIWKEEPGNQDKTLADFIYFLGHGESAYEIAVRYGYTGTEAEYNMLYFDAVDVANTAGQNAQQAADTANEMAAQAQDAAELADAATTNANNAATAAAATVDAAIDNMEDTLNAAIAAQDAEIASKEAEINEQFATQTALINQKQMEVGAVPSDLIPTEGSTHWVMSDGVFSSVCKVGEERFDMSTATVATSNNSYVTPSKTEDSAQWSVVATSTDIRSNLITIPNLVVGEKYNLKFDFVSTLSTTSFVVFAKWVRTSSVGNVTVSYVGDNFYEIAINGSGSVNYDFVYMDDMDYLCFGFTQPTVGQSLTISNVSIKEVNYVKNAIFDKQISTMRVEPPVSSGFLNNKKTRIRIMYNCSTRGRVTARFNAPSNMSTVQVLVLTSYNPSTGTIDNNNTLKYEYLSLGVSSTFEWDYSNATCIVVNAYTGRTMTDSILSTFINNFSIIIEDISGERGLEQRVDELETIVSPNWIKQGAISNCSSAGAYYVSSVSNEWESSNAWDGYFVKVIGGTYVNISAMSGGGIYLAILKSKTITTGSIADFASGENSIRNVAASANLYIQLPIDAQYIWYGIYKTTYEWLPPMSLIGEEYVDSQWLDDKINNQTYAPNLWDKTSDWVEGEYEGERMVLPKFKQKCRMKLWLSGTSGGSASTAAAQGMAISGNYLFRAYNGGTCICYPFNAGECGSGVSFDFGCKGSRTHCNTLQFAHNVEDENDFPYLYISKYYNDNNEGAICYVENVTTSSSTLVQTITIDNSIISGNSNFNIDEDGYIYATTATDNTYSYIWNIYKFRKVSVSEGANVLLTSADLIEEIHITTVYKISEYLWQGSKIYNHKLYVFFGNTNKKIGFFVFDLESKSLANVVYLNSVINKEIEDGDFQDGILYTLSYNTEQGVKFIAK